ncbi:NADPH-dependent FMN reductase [[Mycobacterium] wendilense]|uniref:NADPH-dependent FMN reductase n=1 Tax=[Mycobacterium] wendilense TaxID=3064284 RepID=A0ABN9P0H6_9MYCO|nr:NADPH-dependent FMN reductase [Mycolicibacterium sp. MU0050]CAJ1584217.1 NADPH-dependent FMN reductase [Mycolicibacterium sp. MU0050]
MVETAETTADVKVLVLVGSLRAESVNRQIAELAVANAPKGVTLTIHEGLDEVPFYNEDIDAEPLPAAAAALREAALGAHAVLAVTPENNGTVPAVLKNAIDWLSRPYGNSPIKDKPVAVIGAALGRYGGSWAHDDGRKSFGIAGGAPVEEISLSVSTREFDGRHPGDSAEFVDRVRAAVQRLTAEVVEVAAAT